jgi:hypothetical protein
MKNVKLLASAFAVLAIAGTALAFKPKTTTPLFHRNPTSGICNVFVTNVDAGNDITEEGRLGTAGPCQTVSYASE